MIDYFALLNEARKPWIDPEKLKAKFLSLSAELHPDRVGTGSDTEKAAAQERFTDLNAAYHCLRDPKERLRHLLELEIGTRPREVQTIPPELMDLFMQLSAPLKAVDKFLAEKKAVTSPLLQVQFFESGQVWVEKLEDLEKRIGSWLAGLRGELEKLNAQWTAIRGEDSSVNPAALKQLEQFYQFFSYLGRWLAQIQERKARISFG